MALIAISFIDCRKLAVFPTSRGTKYSFWSEKTASEADCQGDFSNKHILSSLYLYASAVSIPYVANGGSSFYKTDWATHTQSAIAYTMKQDKSG
ncbi:MAG: hypothetical protein IJO15_08555 [Clostridia bacterium]|nr:hypothetical protein [Clostridia bacterium]